MPPSPPPPSPPFCFQGLGPHRNSYFFCGITFKRIANTWKEADIESLKCKYFYHSTRRLKNQKHKQMTGVRYYSISTKLLLLGTIFSNALSVVQLWCKKSKISTVCLFWTAREKKLTIFFVRQNYSDKKETKGDWNSDLELSIQWVLRNFNALKFALISI